ncbi:septation protein A [Sphingomonas sp. LY160]|uniref:septation protein A n=1 Tax=Sphingomonas sp. LY160 TaxID=3095342 RepID=UPI002ADECC27|nr:septation protein A [Sphingomonas sp. LY160]MEA1071267.1 septation protein A [Sphingomonas sp. LY160]
MSETPAKQEPGGISRLLIDIGPLLVFFVVNFLAPVPGPIKVFVATGAFMAAMIAALVYSAVRFKHISPLLLFSGVMVVVLGGLTIWLHNETFIKVKPTIYYGLVAALLTFGLLTGRSLLKSVLGSAYPGLDEDGWRKLTRNWAIFFAVMAVFNEIVWRNSTTDFWIGFKLWGAIPATLLFAFANVPMLIRHGLTTEEKAAAEPGPID